jgi:hypothetical protein
VVPLIAGTLIVTRADNKVLTSLVLGRGERVLLVEDEPAARSCLCDVLEMFGYATVAVEDAEQGLALLGFHNSRISLLQKPCFPMVRGLSAGETPALQRAEIHCRAGVSPA